jgi:hypothetical protein
MYYGNSLVSTTSNGAGVFVDYIAVWMEQTLKINGHERKEIIYGRTCPTCKSDKMQKNGTCYVCLNCGSTTGCG